MTTQAENPYRRIKALGVKSASLIDLLAMGLAEQEAELPSAENRARQLSLQLGNIREIGDISHRVLAPYASTEFGTYRCLALLELGRRLVPSGKGPAREVCRPEHVAKLLDYLRYEKREHFVVVLLDTQGVLMKASTVHIGTLNAAMVGPREVFREAIREGASSIIVAHNHPSGVTDPSQEDREITKRLVEVGKLLDIPVQDHLILGERSYFSFLERGQMP